MNNLPEETILEILNKIDLKSLTNCADVSKRFKQVSLDKSLWSHFQLKPGCYPWALLYPWMSLTGCNELNQVPPELIEKIIAKGCQFLDLSICRKQPQVDMTCLPQEVNLKGLKLSYTHCYDENFHNANRKMLEDMIKPCKSLKKLAIIGKLLYACHYNPRFVYFYPIFHCGLYCRVVYIAERLVLP